MSGDKYLIWSNEHSAWWRPNRRGYTVHLDAAGRYSRFEAIKTSEDAGWVTEGIPPEIPVREEDVLGIIAIKRVIR